MRDTPDLVVLLAVTRLFVMLRDTFIACCLLLLSGYCGARYSCLRLACGIPAAFKPKFGRVVCCLE